MDKFFLLKYFYKYTDKAKYRDLKEQKRHLDRKKRLTPEFNLAISDIKQKISEKKKLNFKHSGHIGDVMYALPVLKELSKTHECNLYINVGQPASYAYRHISGNVYISEPVFLKLLPLLQEIPYLNIVARWEKQSIDIDLDLFREFPFDLNFPSVRWFSHITGIFPDFSEPTLDVAPDLRFRDKIVILRTHRARNSFVDYSFLKNFNNLLFIGLPDEFHDLQKDIPNIEYHHVENFLEMAQIIKASKFYIGNQSFGFSIAESLKVPRLLEAYPDFPVVHPIGGVGADFYFQQHFEALVSDYNSKIFPTQF